MNKQGMRRHGATTVAAALLALLLNAVTGMPAAGPTQQGALPVSGLSDFADHEGYTALFDGKTLDGWDGKPGLWKVEDGVISAEITPGMFPEKMFPNTFLIKHGLEAKDFDLKLEIKMEKGGGSGIQYRSSVGFPPGKAGDGNDPRWTMTGPQADFWYPANAEASQWSGQFYSQNTPRGIVARRGQVVLSLPGEKPQVVGSVGDCDKLGAFVKTGDWNQYEVIARGGVMVHILNGQLMAVLIDDDPASTNNQPGKIGIELESTPAKVSVRNIWIKKLD